LFEIGSSLREARTRRGLAMSDVERDTRIRSRYLTALEEDRFDDLPGPAYAKGFLRTYAEFLDLDGQRFVDEYNSRFAPDEEPAGAPPVRIQRRRRPRDRLALAIPIAAVLVGLIAWQTTRGGGSTHKALPISPPPPTAPTVSPPRPRSPARSPAIARLAFVAARGPSWLAVHIGSAAGPAVYVRTLEPGQTARFVSRRLWVRIGAPWNLDATLNGKSVSLPASTGNVLATAAGLANG
jgi:transcriptional regulator with XRE-family HTH domain